MSKKSSNFAVAKVKKYDDCYLWKCNEVRDAVRGAAYLGVYDRKGRACATVAGVAAGVEPARVPGLPGELGRRHAARERVWRAD